MIPKIIIGFFAGLALLVGLLVLWQRIAMIVRGVRTTGRGVSDVTRVEPSAAEIDRLLPMWFLPVGCIGFGSFLIGVIGCK